MPIFKQAGNQLISIKEMKIDLEKTVQGLIEKNLDDVFGLEFVCSEYALKNLRIDTLGFDEELKTFVIIEYKKDKSFSVVDQGYAYLALLLNNKADFILEYNEKCKKNLKKADVDWSQSKVIFIASSFTKYQQEAMGFKDLPIELWEVKLYDNDLLLLNEIRPAEKNESIKTIAKDKNIEVVSKEIKQYTLEDHLKPEWKKTKSIFESLSTRIQELDPNFEVHPVKYYIGFQINNRNVIELTPQAAKVLVELLRVKPEDLRDPENRTNYRQNSYKYYGKHITQFNVNNEDDVDYAMMLIKQVYKRFTE